MIRPARPKRRRWTVLLRGAEGGGRRHAWPLFPALALILAGWPRPSAAQVGEVTLTVIGEVRFPDAAPDMTPVIGPSTITVQVRVRTPNGTPWTLALLADSDLRSGADVIPAGAVSWTATPAPMFRAGTLSAAVPVLAGSGAARVNRSASFSFYLQNQWAWNPGDYRTTVTMTLSSP